MLRSTLSDFAITRATIIKDYMREGTVKEISDVLMSYVMHNISNPNSLKVNYKTISNSIKIIAQLIDWNDLNIFSNFITTILENLLNEILQSDILVLLNAVISKGKKCFKYILRNGHSTKVRNNKVF